MLSIYTIIYAQGQEQALEPGYLVLSNISNPRPDWREYWPIRNFLLEHPLEEDRYYGFFSPKFGEKTDLSYPQVVEFINQARSGTDVVIFSPQVDIGAFFPNVFAGEEMADPGFLSTCNEFAERVGLPLDLSRVLMDTSNTVFSNYIVARPVFWREWLALNERMFQIAESGDVSDPLWAKLNHQTNYLEGVPRKVFLMERMASLLLYVRPELKVRAYNPFRLRWSSQLQNFRREAVICDALKIAARVNGFPEYRDVFAALQVEVLLGALGKQREEILKEGFIPEDFNSGIASLLPVGLNSVAELNGRNDALANHYLAQSPESRWAQFRQIHPDGTSVGLERWLFIRKGEPSELAALKIFDAWILDGVLDNCSDPLALLRVIRNALVPGGMILISARNAQHWQRQARLSLGRAGLAEGGESRRLEGRYTRVEINELLIQAGYRIGAGVSRIFFPDEAVKYLSHIRAFAQLGGGDPNVAEADAKVFQYVISAISES